MRLIDADALQEEYVRLSGKELSLIDDAPTVEPKHGHWEFKPLWQGAEAKYCECSACHHPVWWPTDYCPNCGAKMDEVEDGIKQI